MALNLNRRITELVESWLAFPENLCNERLRSLITDAAPSREHDNRLHSVPPPADRSETEDLSDIQR